MREYSGMTLARLFQHSGPLPLAQWQDIAERLLRAVGLLHRRQILHRDIKPENLHLGDDGELRLLDFGLAYCPGCPKTHRQRCREPRVISPRKRFAASHRVRNRICTRWA
jgi:serine/threonine protein kinase